MKGWEGSVSKTDSYVASLELFPIVFNNFFTYSIHMHLVVLIIFFWDDKSFIY